MRYLLVLLCALPGTAFAGTDPLPAPRCEPLIRGALWWLRPERESERLRETLDAMEGVGMNLLWLLHTSELAADPQSTLLDRIFAEADRRGWRVIIETSHRPRWYHDWDIPAEITANRAHVENVTRRYAHHRSFFGWYLNYEIYMEWDEKSRKIRELYRAIGRMTRELTPRAKLTISPFFLADKDGIRDAFRYAEPSEYGDWWAETIRDAGIDIVMLQDSGAEHCECVPLETRVAFFGAMQRACLAAGAELWGNVETVEFLAKDWDEYGRRLREHRAAGTEYPWSFDMQRNAWKLDLASRFGTNIVTWGWEFWNPVFPQSKVGRSEENYAAYRRYYEAKRKTPAGSSAAGS